MVNYTIGAEGSKVRNDLATCENLLNLLAEASAALDLLNIEIEAARNEVIPEEVRAELAAIEFEYAAKVDHANERIKWLTNEAKDAALRVGYTVKSERVQAVYAKGRITWDAKALDGYLIHQPALAAFRSEGEPSISIRWNKR